MDNETDCGNNACKQIVEDHHISYDFQKRSGTSGLSGQLYETKLLSLILFRTSFDTNVKDFALGTNMEGLGAFDDIILRYETKDTHKTKLLFLQAKHKDDPDKDKISVQDIMKPNGDFSLVKYFDSYLKIKHKFTTDKNNIIFKDSIDNVECEFIIYTTAKEQITKNKIASACTETYLESSKNGKVFQFTYDSQDLEGMVSTFTKSRVTQLAKELTKCILKNNFENIMAHGIIKEYHVFLAQNVISLECTDKGSNIGKFRESFLISNNEYLSLMKRIIFKEIADIKGISSINQQNQVQDILISCTLKLPLHFGNRIFQFYGNKKKQEKRLNYMCSLFVKLIQNGVNIDTNSTYIFIKLDNRSVGPDKIINTKDLENYRLGGLVGNLLVYDVETQKLKFDLNEDNLSMDAVNILHRLKDKYDLNRYRFDINTYNFPRLTLYATNYDRNEIAGFLNKLKFYSNQAKEDEVERILKQEIHNYFNSQQTQRDNQHMKCNAVYLKLHDKIQKWWKKPDSTPFLTKSSRFYQQVEKEILDSSLLNIINYIYCKRNNECLVEFKYETVVALGLEQYLNSDQNMLLIVTDEINFSSKKLIQYFDTMKSEIDYSFLDIDFMVSANCLEIVNYEVERSTLSVLIIVVSGDCFEANKEIINRIINIFNGKIILLSHSKFKDHFKETFNESYIIKDTKNNFSSLTYKLQKIILEERQVVFQGVEVNINSVLTEDSLNHLSPELLSKIIHKNDWILGQTLLNALYLETSNYYIQQSISRYISLLSINRRTENIERHYFLTEEENDIIVVAKSINFFEEICQKNLNKNVHWFIQHDSHHTLMWQQSCGGLQTLLEYIVRMTYEDCSLQIHTLKDIQEKLVIISAEPGMGKSTLLAHTAVNTKRLYPNMWILKINLLDNINQFSKWKEGKINVNLKEAISFLYTTSIQNYYAIMDNIDKLLTITNNNEICFSDNYSQFLPEVDLSEAKLLTHFYNNNNLVVVFDGFDEICPDYAKEVIQLLSALKSSNIAHLWVTSRQYNVLQQLELSLGTFSFSINTLTRLQQKQFLENVWCRRLGLTEQITIAACRIYVDKFYSSMSTVLDDYGAQFLSLPLHLSLISEIYEEFVIDNFQRGHSTLSKECVKEIKDTNLITLYTKFAHMKFIKIRFSEKKQSISFKDPDMRKMLDEQFRIFLKNHKKIAAYSLFDKSILLSQDDIDDVHEFMENINSGEEKTGIIEHVLRNGYVKFVHFTFAEYFAVEFIFDKLSAFNCPSAIWKYFIKNILSNFERRAGIRRFVNGKLQQDQSILVNLRSNPHNLKVVFNILLAEDIKNGTTIHHAIQYDYYNIIIFVLGCIKPLVNKDNVHLFLKYIKTDILCPFCFAIVKRKPYIVQYIIEIFTDIGCKLKDLFCTHRYIFFEHVLADDACPEIFHIVLNAWSQFDTELMVDILTTMDKDIDSGDIITQAHKLALHPNTFERCINYFSKLNKEDCLKIFSVKDTDGQIPAHYAAKNNYPKFFIVMDDLLGREEFKKMCTITDNNGFTPISRLTSHDACMHHEDLKKVLNMFFGADSP